MYKFLNLHPQGKLVGDCAKRAIAAVENRDYMEVQRELNRLKKETGWMTKATLFFLKYLNSD